MSTTVTVDASRLTASLGSSDAVRAALERVAVKVATTAKRLCPVDTGRLRSSIEFEVTEDAGGLVARVGSDVLYAEFVEGGTSRMAAQPYLRPALTSVLGGLAPVDSRGKAA